MIQQHPHTAYMPQIGPGPTLSRGHQLGVDMLVEALSPEQQGQTMGLDVSLSPLHHIPSHQMPSGYPAPFYPPTSVSLVPENDGYVHQLSLFVDGPIPIPVWQGEGGIFAAY
jgi:hypothetical protein